MFKIFTILADKIVYVMMGLSPDSRFASGLHFFIEDITKIFVLLFVLIYIISYLRASLNVEAVRDYLAGKNRFVGYIVAAMFGAVTPFCSCSSIPLFLGFTQARIPVGITMAFLMTSPMINEVAVALLYSLLGPAFTVAYVAVGLIAGILGGMFFDLIKSQRFLTDLAAGAREMACCDCGQAGEQEKVKLTAHDRHVFAKTEMFTILGRIWKWIFIGVGLGAGLHGYVPDDMIAKNLGDGQWWSVPSAVLLGIPLYANASGIIPVVESLLSKGLPVGTTLAFMMSTVAASMPEFVMLKQVMQTKMLVMFFCVLLVMFTLSGWLFNAIW